MLHYCPKCPKPLHKSALRTLIVRTGFFRRKSDQRWVQRLRCKKCNCSFSFATYDKCYRQKRRDLNRPIFNLLSSGVTLRRISYLLSTNRKTVYRKLLFLGKQSLLDLRAHNLNQPTVSQIEFDDLETFEHSKCKPLSVTLAVAHGSRRILGFSVSSMPAKGLLSRRALKKYGPRVDNRKSGRALLMQFLKGLVNEEVLIKSDQNPHYPKDVAEHFPKALHLQFKGRLGAETGQGELKKAHFDPLFSLNHTCAKLRADIARLIRKTWSTTKKAENLRYHLAIMSLYHNRSLLAAKRV